MGELQITEGKNLKLDGDIKLFANEIKLCFSKEEIEEVARETGFVALPLLAVAEMERNTIVERTQTGKAIAKTKEGFKEGRPKIYRSKQINNAIEMLKNNSYTEVAEITGILSY